MQLTEDRLELQWVQKAVAAAVKKGKTYEALHPALLIVQSEAFTGINAHNLSLKPTANVSPRILPAS